MITKERLESIRVCLRSASAPAYELLCDELLEEVVRLHRAAEATPTLTYNDRDWEIIWRFAEALGFEAGEPQLTVARVLGRASDAKRAWLAASAPVPMRLNCPECGELHLDEGEFATKSHYTHSCQKCGLTWRPAVVATVGVRFLPGFKNEP